MVVFGVKGGYDAAVKIIDNIKLFRTWPTWRRESLILHRQHVALAAFRGTAEEQRTHPPISFVCPSHRAH